MKKILILGSINIDLTIETPYIPAAGETVTGRNFLVNPGGKGANQAVAARRLGGTVCFSGCVGDDAFGRREIFFSHSWRSIFPWWGTHCVGQRKAGFIPF